MYEYKGRITRIIDGDTLETSLSIGFHISHLIRLRLAGVNTPEKYGVKKGSPEYLAGVEASEFVEELLPVGSFVRVKTFKDKTGKYGRYIAEVYFQKDDQTYCLNDMLIAKGYGA